MSKKHEDLCLVGQRILSGAARALFVAAYADAIEEGEIKGPRPGPQEDWMDFAPETPESAETSARLLLSILMEDVAAWGEFIARGDVRHDPEGAGHLLAMQALGHGVAWSDDHPDHGFGRLPLWEYAIDETELPDCNQLQWKERHLLGTMRDGASEEGKD